MYSQVKVQEGEHAAEHVYVYTLPMATVLLPAMEASDSPREEKRLNVRRLFCRSCVILRPTYSPLAPTALSTR